MPITQPEVDDNFSSLVTISGAEDEEGRTTFTT